MIEINELSIKVKITDSSEKKNNSETNFQQKKNQPPGDKVNDILEQVSRILKNKKER